MVPPNAMAPAPQSESRDILTQHVSLRTVKSSHGSPPQKACLVLPDFSKGTLRKISSTYSDRLPNALDTYKAREGKKRSFFPHKHIGVPGAFHLALKDLGSAGHRQILPWAPACKQPATFFKHLVRYRKQITITTVPAHKNRMIFSNVIPRWETIMQPSASQKHELTWLLCFQRFLHCTWITLWQLDSQSLVHILRAPYLCTWVWLAKRSTHQTHYHWLQHEPDINQVILLAKKSSSWQ